MSPINPLQRAKAPKNEREYLQQQARLARSALKNVGKQTAQTASGKTTLVSYVDQHPFLSLGLAALGGAFLGRWLAGPRAASGSEPRRRRRPLSSHLSSIYQTVVAPPLRAAVHQVIAQISHGFATQHAGNGQAKSEETAYSPAQSSIP